MWKRLGVAVVCLLMVAACSAQDQSSGDSTATPPTEATEEPTERPTATARPTPRPTPTAVAREELNEVDHGFSTFRGQFDDGDNLSWAVLLENSNPADTWIATSLDVNVSFTDSGGGVVATARESVAAILPGQRVGLAGNDSYFSNPDLGLITGMEVQLSTPTWEMADGPLGTFTVSGIQTRTSEFGDVTTTATVASTFERELESVYAVAVYYDSEHNIIGGDWTFVDFVPAGGQIPIEVGGLSSIPNINQTAVYLTLSFISLG
jgi:hypothetical protein